MKKLIILFSFLVFTSFTKTIEEVYVCQSKGTTKYHYKETCRGLNACKHTVVKKTIKDAKAIGLTLCGWED